MSEAERSSVVAGERLVAAVWMHGIALVRRLSVVNG
jgi:hypothetical protein